MAVAGAERHVAAQDIGRASAGPLPRAIRLPKNGQDLDAPSSGKVRHRAAVGAELLRSGAVSADDMVKALAHHGREAGLLRDVLRARGLVVERDLLQVVRAVGASACWISPACCLTPD